MSKKVIGLIQVLLGGLCFGFLGIFGKVLFAYQLSVGEILAFRFFIAALVLGLGLFIFKAQLLKISIKQLVICFLLGTLGYALFASFYFKAIEGVSVALAAMLLFTYPVLVHLLGVLLGLEKPNKVGALCLVLVMAGLYLVLKGEIEIKSWWSVGAGLLAAISYAIYVVASNRYQGSIHPLTANFYIMTSATFALVLFYKIKITNLMGLPQSALFAILGLAVVCTILAMSFFLAGLQKLKASEAAIASAIEPIAAVIYSMVFMHTPINFTSMVGSSMIVASIIISALYGDSK